MGFITKLALGVLAVSGVTWWQNPPSYALPVSNQAERYELAVQRGAAERLLALNRLGQAEIAAYWALKQAEVEDHEKGDHIRQNMVASIFSGSFSGFGKVVTMAVEGGDKLERARKEYRRNMTKIEATRKLILELDPLRHVEPVPQ